MKLDSLVFMAYIFGVIFIFLGTLIRFSFSSTEQGKLIRLINAIKVVDPRIMTSGGFGMLIQLTGINWLALGTAYGVVIMRFLIIGIIDDCLTLLVLFGPLVLFMGMLKLLQIYYWQRQK